MAAIRSRAIPCPSIRGCPRVGRRCSLQNPTRPRRVLPRSAHFGLVAKTNNHSKHRAYCPLVQHDKRTDNLISALGVLTLGEIEALAAQLVAEAR